MVAKTPPRKTRRGPRPAVLAGLAGLALVVAAAGWLIWFGAWRYPAHGLTGLEKRDYLRAMDIAARGAAGVEGLSFEGFDFLKFREVATGPEAYVWGAARCLGPDGTPELLWTYLEWSSSREQWLRGYSLVLADPEDEIYYSRTRPGQWDRLRFALRRLWRQNRLHLAEVYDAPVPGASP